MYHIRFVCVAGGSYVGSTVDMRGRWSKHKYGFCHANWTVWGLTSHFGQFHSRNLEANINKLEVTLLDSCLEEKHLKRLENKWMCNMGTLYQGGLNTRNDLLNHKRRNYGGS